jgi:tetratricopeptide (TPR) repeat protein
MYFGTRLFVFAFAVALVPQLAAAQNPRVSRYTALSAGRIAEAQRIEDEELQLESWQEVLEAINTGIERDDDNPEAYLHLGIAQVGLSNYLAADSAFDRAEDMYPDYVDEEGGTSPYRLNGWLQAYTDASARMAEQDVEGAVELYHIANLIYDRRPEAYLNVGSQLVGLDDLEGSIDAWRSAIAIIESPDIDPGDDETRETWDTQFWSMSHSNLGRVLEMAQRPEEAIPVYETLLERYPDNQEARSSLAMVLARTGQGDDALTIFDEILDRDDGTALDYFNAGVTLYQADEFGKASVGFVKALERAPMFRDALQNISQTFSILEDYEAQVPYSERLLELDPHNEYVYQIHIRALIQVGRQADGVGALEIMQGLPFITDNLQLQPMASGGRVSGTAMNKTLATGTSITLRFTFYDNDGSPVGSEDVEVTISDPGVAQTFQLTYAGGAEVLGYGYEFVN